MAHPDATAADAVPRRIRLHLLHTPRVVGEDGREHVLAGRDAALLALVALEGPITRSRAAAMVWPGADEHRPLNNLRQRLFRLRRLVGADLVLQGPMLQLAPAVEHDLADRDRALRHDPDAARGDVLGGLAFDDDSELASWVEGTRQRWRAARIDALLGMATRLEAEDRLAEAVRYATRVTADDPLSEHGTRVLMRLHHRRGDRGAALAEYDRCVTALHQWLGEAPSAETNRLAEHIGRADAPHAAVPAWQMAAASGTPPPAPPERADAPTGVPAGLAGADALARQLACVAALSGDAFDAALAAAVLGCPPARLAGPWCTLEALQVLRGARFSHEHMRQAVEASVPAALKPAIHRDIARALQAQGVAALQRVPHWEAAAAWPEAAADLGEAAAEAWRDGRCAQAGELLRRAARCHRQAGQRDAAFRCEWRAAQFARRPRPATEALAADLDRLAAAEARGDALAAAHFAGLCARHHARLGDTHAAIASARRAVSLARRVGPGSGCVLAAEMGLAGHLGDAGRFGEALPLAGTVIARSLPGGFVTLAVSAENERAVMLWRLGRADLAARLLRDLPTGAPRWTVALRRLARARVDPGHARRQPALLAQAYRELADGAAPVDPYGRHKLALEAARLQDAPHACGQAVRVRAWADAHGHVALARHAAMVEVEALCALGRPAAAADAAAALLAGFGGRWQAYGYWLPELWCTCHRALAAAGRQAAAGALAGVAAAWLGRCADEHVPPPFRTSFLERNPFHARLRQLAADSGR